MSFSNELIVEIAEQHYVLGQTLGKIAERFALNYSTLAEALKQTVKKLEPCLEKLKLEYLKASVGHTDETSWRTDGSNGYSWYFRADKVTFHLFWSTRSSSVVKEVLGTQPLSGFVVVDRYGRYNRVPGSIQYCYVHLLREMKDLAAELEADQEIKNYTREMKLHLADAMQLRKRGLSEAEYLTQAGVIRKKIEELSNRQASHPAIRKRQDFFIEKAESLYQWCQSSQIPAVNNYDEREIRKIVIARK